MTTTAHDLIATERRRQITDEGYDANHDHGQGELLALAAECYRLYALSGTDNGIIQKDCEWPWAYEFWKPKNTKRDLIRAGALALAAHEAGDATDVQRLGYWGLHQQIVTELEDVLHIEEMALAASAGTSFPLSELEEMVVELRRAGLTSQQIIDGAFQGAIDIAISSGHTHRAAEKAARAIIVFGLTVPMRVLTVKQPWAYAIAAGWKDVENRTWSTGYRGIVAIHAGLDLDEEYLSKWPLGKATPNYVRGLTRGHIVAVVDLVDVIRDSPSAWAEEGEDIFHWLLVNAREIDSIKYTGGLGLRHLDEDVAAQITKQLEEGTR